MAWYDQLTTAELETLKASALAELDAITTRGQFVSADGKVKTHAQIGQIRDLLKEICEAIERKTAGGIPTRRAVPCS